MFGFEQDYQEWAEQWTTSAVPEDTSTCASSMLCHSWQLIGRSCSNPAHILNHQFRRKRTHAGVSQWPLKLRTLDLGRHLRPCFKKSLNWWCCCLMASRNPVATCRWQERGCLFQVRARMIRALNNWCHAGSKKTCASSMSCQSCQLMWLSCSNPVHIDHQYWRKGTHAGISQWAQWENHALPSFLFAEDQINEECLLVSFQVLKAENAGLRQTPQTLFREDSWLLILLSDGFQESCRYMSLTGKRLPVPSQSKNDQSFEQLVSCWKQENLC